VVAEDVYPAERSEDVYPDERSEDVVAPPPVVFGEVNATRRAP
jgi:hypothetical protein